MIRKLAIDVLGWHYQTFVKNGYSNDFAKGRVIQIILGAPLLLLISVINFTHSKGYWKIDLYSIALILLIVGIIIYFLIPIGKENSPFWNEIIKNSESDFSTEQKVCYFFLLILPLVIFILSFVFA